MPKRLILIRHAKSSWDGPLDDHARPLNARGRKAASVIGSWLNTKGYVPDQIFSSDAIRTRETTARLAAEFPVPPAVVLSNDMYLAAPDTLLGVLRQAEAESIALVAHNPGIGMLAAKILKTAAEHPRFQDYPTGATLVCDFGIEKWANAAPRAAI